MDFKNLVFEGGGAKIFAEAGTLLILEEKNILSSIENVAGTSAGSIIATLVALNYTAKEIHDILFDINFPEIEDEENYFKLLNSFGIYAGGYFLSILKKYIKDKTGNENSTFLDLKNAGYKNLSVIATNLKLQTDQVFNVDNTPDVIVAEAVRCSMSIPIVFEAFKLSQGYDPTAIFVDGGVVWNLPIELYDTKEGQNPETLAIALWDYNSQSIPLPIEFGHIGLYIKSLFETLLDAQSIELSASTNNDYRLIKVDDLGISATNFKITTEQKTSLYNSGINYATKFFNN
jgi:NTE family protein